MSETGPEDPAPPASPPNPDPDAATAPAREEASAVQRRVFLRQITGDAVVTAARLAGLTTVVRRSIVAAGEAATRELAPLDDGPEAAGSSGMARDAAGTVAPPDALRAAPVAPAPLPPATPTPPPVPATPVSLSPRQEALLTTAPSAVLATNDPSGTPTLTASAFHWDGTHIRIPSDLFSARVTRIDADPRVSVLIADAAGGWVAVTGTAAIVSGDAVEADMATILRKSMTDEDAETSWTELRASGNPVVITVTPSRYLWRLD